MLTEVGTTTINIKDRKEFKIRKHATIYLTL